MSAAVGSGPASGSPANKMPIWDLEGPQLDEWVKQIRSLFPDKSDDPSAEDTAKQQFIPVLWNNLQTALSELKTEAIREGGPNHNTNGNDASEPPAKKAKQRKERITGYRLHDPYKLWIHVKEDTDILSEAIPASLGGKLSELSVAGILNGFAVVGGGFVDRYLEPVAATEFPTSAGNCNFALVKPWAHSLHQSVQTRLEKDVLDTTPQRIAHMLCPDLSSAEFKAVRRRVYDTVVLGKGLKIEDATEEIPVASGNAVLHDIEKFKKCKICGENDQSAFILDRRNGDVICSSCGTVVSESIMHEGTQYRKFEGEVDRNHSGDAPNPLYSNAHNMSTSLGGVQATSGAGMGGFGSQRNGRGLETVLRNAHAFTELNVSSFANSKDAQGRTRVGYKDKQKKQAFVQMNHVGDALNLHEAVVQRAKEIFAGFRDDRELLHQLKAVIGACLCEAFDQLAAAGRKILQQQETGYEDEEKDAKGEGGKSDTTAAKSEAMSKRLATNSRAVKRAGLHSASMAGKGGLALDYSGVERRHATKAKTEEAANSMAGGASSASGMSSRFETKSSSTWDLEDCRSWLLEASRKIAQRWVEERDGTHRDHTTDGNNDADEKNGNGKRPAPAAKNYPKGSRDELEGNLVEHSITICEFLETQMKSTPNANSAVPGKRVHTPRADMSKIGIKWQNHHERGSGGKGGVGNSGTFKQRAVSAASTRSPGQILLLQSAKKLGEVLKDPLAGEAFHKELRALVGRQKARKDRELRDEASRQRMQQMKRKPWLQAKITGK